MRSCGLDIQGCVMHARLIMFRYLRFCQGSAFGCQGHPSGCVKVMRLLVSEAYILCPRHVWLYQTYI